MLTLSSTVVENTTGLYIFSLVDAAGQGLAASQIEALTLTYYDVASKAILNSREGQDVLNTNHVALETVAGPPLVTTITWTLQPADTVILDDAWSIEPHAAIFRWTWDSGTRHGAHAVQFGIENVADAPVVA
jgi:hypothetical protein